MSYLGEGLQAGDDHYRAYVGQPKNYDLVGANTFCLLVSLGLRQSHTLLDVGCGSLRAGRLFIPYLNRGNYTGIDPNRWLIKAGIENETGRDQIDIKKPKFYCTDSMVFVPRKKRFDYVVAQSIFTHCGLDIIEGWLSEIGRHVRPSAKIAATFQFCGTDYDKDGWVYPAAVKYRVGTIEAIAHKLSMTMELLDWEHTQKWVLFRKKE